MRDSIVKVLIVLALGGAGATLYYGAEHAKRDEGAPLQVTDHVQASTTTRPSARVEASPAPAEAALAKLRGELTGSELRAALLAELERLAETDPALATQLAASLSDEEGRAEALHECLPHWLKAAPEAARSWLLSTVRSLPAETAQALARDAAASDPELGFAVAEQIYIGSRAPAMREVFSAWTARDPQAASGAVQRLSKADGYFGAVEEIGRLWAENDAKAAYGWASRLEQEDARRTALTPVINAWALRDPAEAASAVDGLPPAAWRTRLVSDVAGHYGRVDPERARSWVVGIAEPADREAGATTLLTEMLATNAERAAKWALELGGGAESRIVDKVITMWLARDAQAAEQWLRQHPEARPKP